VRPPGAAAASRRRLASGIWLAVCAAACTWWPPPGSGGMAERSRPDRPRCTGCLRPPDPTWQELDTQRQLVQGRLERLVLRGAEWCLPAHVTEARDLQTRIVRELYGGLPLDAADDLIIARAELAELERRLDSIQKTGACTSAATAGAPLPVP
jgi:hypothetical protein